MVHAVVVSHTIYCLKYERLTLYMLDAWCKPNRIWHTVMCYEQALYLTDIIDTIEGVRYAGERFGH